MPEEAEHALCPLCGADDAPVLYRTCDHLFAQPDEFTFVRCMRCRLVYLNPRPTFAALARFYPDEYFCYHPTLDRRRRPERALGGLVGWLARRRIRQLERYVGRIPATARVVDVGCGANAFLFHLHRLRGCDTLGIDRNAAVVAAIREHLRLPAEQGTLPDCRLPSEAFDGVAMYEYLEHESDPRGVLAEARRVTRPGGWLALEIPNVGSGLAKLFGCHWCQLDAPRHLVLYDPCTIRAMLDACGYDVITIRPLCYQWMFGFSVLTALGFRRMGSLRPVDLALAVAATLPVLPLPWLFPEFMRVYARRR